MPRRLYLRNGPAAKLREYERVEGPIPEIYVRKYVELFGAPHWRANEPTIAKGKS